MADSPVSGLNTRGTPDRAVDQIYVINSGAQYRSTINNELGITGAPVGTTDTQVLTNKTFTSPTINGATLSGTLSGTYTIGGTPTFPASVVTLTGSQTLTNKVLTSPTISSPTITNASITQDSVVGFTTANSGTVYGVAVTTGTISGTVLSAGTVSSTALATNAVQGNQLATNAITLGYQPITTNYSTSSTSSSNAVTGLSVTVTIPSGGRRVRITVYAPSMFLTTAGDYALLSIWDGTVGSGTQLSRAIMGALSANSEIPVTATAIVTPSAGSKTYNVGLCNVTAARNVQINAAATYPAFILVETI